MEYNDPQYGYPKFHWIDDDTLIVDLGKISWLRSPVDKVGIHITYSYIKADIKAEPGRKF